MKKTNVTRNQNLEISERERERVDQVCYHVYRTYDYSKFKQLLGNRDVKDNREKRIAASIDRIGWIHEPIVVNENYEIINGNGRFAVCKSHGYPVEYIVQKNTGLKECITLNSSSTNWNTENYVDSFAVAGIEDYVRLKRLFDMFPSYSYSTIAIENRTCMVYSVYQSR